MSVKYFVRWDDGGEERRREFSSKPEAFRWFNWECPANEAYLEELLPDGSRRPPKTLRRRDPFGTV